MSAHELTDRDPLQYVEHALRLLPDDPSQTTAIDLARLAAVAEGAARHTLVLRSEMAALARRALDCADDPEQLATIAEERDRVQGQEELAAIADEQLNAYTSPALSAHGLDLDRLMAAGD